MKISKSSNINNLKATHDRDKLVKYGRQLHSEAVFLGVMKFFKFFKPDMEKTSKFKEKRGTLKYSH